MMSLELLLPPPNHKVTFAQRKTQRRILLEWCMVSRSSRRSRVVTQRAVRIPCPFQVGCPSLPSCRNFPECEVSVVRASAIINGNLVMMWQGRLLRSKYLAYFFLWQRKMYESLQTSWVDYL